MAFSNSLFFLKRYIFLFFLSSLLPSTSLITAGMPKNKASSSALEVPSEYDGKTKTSAFAINL